MKKQLTMMVVTAGLVGLSASLWADGKKQTPEEMATTYRQSAFKMVKYHFGSMAAMVKGEMAYDAAAFSRNAEDLVALSRLVPNGFQIPSAIEDSKAKPAIWENQEDFASKAKAFQEAVAELATASASGDMATIKPVFGKAGKTCKSCHDEYKSK